jgi:hypothetical protein
MSPEADLASDWMATLPNFLPAEQLDFVAINAAARQVLLGLCSRWLPGGKRQAMNRSRGTRCGAIGNRGHSRSTSARAAGATSPQATRGGDPSSLVAYLHGPRQSQATRKLASTQQLDGSANTRAACDPPCAHFPQVIN